MKKVIKIILAIVVAVAALVFVFLGRGDNQTQTSPNGADTDGTKIATGTRVGNAAPDFELTDYNGNKVKLSDFRGKSPVFVNFWASWCPFCVDELPLMGKIQGEFAGQYVTLAINRGESQAVGQEFADRVGALRGMTFLNDPSDSTYGRYGGFAMPYSIFVDKDGIVRDSKLGPVTENELRQKLQVIIN